MNADGGAMCSGPDLIVVGAGSAGFSAAARRALASARGKRRRMVGVMEPPSRAVAEKTTCAPPY